MSALEKLKVILVGADDPQATVVQSTLGSRVELSRVATLEEISIAPLIEANEPSMIRFFGRAQSQALTWLGPTTRVPTEVAIMSVADGVMFGAHREPPRAFVCMPDVFCERLVLEKVVLDRSGSGIVILASSAEHEDRAVAIEVASAFSRLGLKRILIVDIDDARAQSLATMLKRRLLGVEIEAVSRSLLTQLPSEASIAVSLVGRDHRDLLEDVSYLNFLKQNGIWIDWLEATRDLGLAEEIKDAGATVLSSAAFKSALEEKCLLELQAYSRGSR